MEAKPKQIKWRYTGKASDPIQKPYSKTDGPAATTTDILDVPILAPTHVAEAVAVTATADIPDVPILEPTTEPAELAEDTSLDILNGPKCNPPAETPAQTPNPTHAVTPEPVTIAPFSESTGIPKNVIANLKTTKGVLLTLVLIKDGRAKKAQSALNEFSQRCGTAGTAIDMINYETKPVAKDRCTGPFEVCVLQGDTCIVKATGHTKKEALQFAALAAIKYLAPVEYEYYISALNLPENVKAAVTPSSGTASDGALVVKQPPKPRPVKLLTARNHVKHPAAIIHEFISKSRTGKSIKFIREFF